MFTFFSNKKHTHPDWISNYLHQDFKNLSSVDDQTYAVLDCETTGLSSTDEIITIGAVKCTSKSIFLDQLLDQKYPLLKSGKSAEIHGELSEQLQHDKTALLHSLISYLENHVIIGHNIAFDIRMINKELKQSFGVTLKNKVIDTAHLIMRLDPVKYERSVGGHSNLHLDDLCREYQIPIENRHTALGDAYLTAQLFQRVVSKLKKRGITETKELTS